MSDKSYDLGKAYDGNLTAKARLHYLENERHIADSPTRMYGKSKGPKMESNAQEKKNLMKDNPIDSKASKGSPAMNQNKGYGKPMASPMKMTGSWMSKHTKSKM